MTYSCILLDLDGTITDSAPGITSTIAWTLQQMGRPVPAAEALLQWVGPPIMDSFRDLAGFDPTESLQALAIYREKYIDQGAYDARLYPGVGSLIQRIHERGIPLSLATSKPELPATLILRHFQLADYFTVITGASADETRSSKADVVGEALLRLKTLGHDTSRPVHIGDRIHDIEGAGAHGVPTIAVEWGYGFEDEHADAAAVVKSTTELSRLLLG